MLAALLLGAVIGVVSLLGRPSGTETPENTAAPTAAPDTSGTPSETPLPEELREAPLSPEAEIAASAAVRSNGFPMLAWAPDGFSGRQPGPMRIPAGNISPASMFPSTSTTLTGKRSPPTASTLR